jgi:hypothetical protein
MQASKSQFLADLDAELESIDEATHTPADAAPKRPRKLRRNLIAATFAMVAPLGLMFNAAPAAAARIDDPTTIDIQSCDDFFKPDFVARTHTKTCRKILAIYDYKYTKTENGGSVRCHWFIKTTIMPCAIPTNEGYVSACGH